VKCVRFWGTRGSLPVALTASAVRRKLITALRGASGRTFASEDELNAYVDTLGMAVAGIECRSESEPARHRRSGVGQNVTKHVRYQNHIVAFRPRVKIRRQPIRSFAEGLLLHFCVCLIPWMNRHKRARQQNRCRSCCATKSSKSQHSPPSLQIDYACSNRHKPSC